MNGQYVNEVRRFGGSAPFMENGRKFNLSHKDNIDPDFLQMDGNGQVDHVPVVWGKPCFGRPERFARGRREGKRWTDADGERRQGLTSCDTCMKRSPGTYEACGRIFAERVASNPLINAAFDKWIEGCKDDFGPICFLRNQAKLWNDFLQAIIDHGGWRNVNDDQVKLEAIRLATERTARIKANRKKRARRLKAARRGAAKPVTKHFLDELQAERDRRAAQLRSLQTASGRTKRDTLWLKKLDCDRIADVWQTREFLLHVARNPTGQAIAEHMFNSGRWPGALPSLRARVYEDLKRLPKLENNLLSAPLWPAWAYSDPTS